MKPAALALFLIIAPMLSAQNPPSPAPPLGDRPGQTPAVTAPPRAKLLSRVYDWEKLATTPTSKGVRRDVFDGPTTTLDRLHCHITTLNPGQNSGAPSRHLQEEIIIVKEGLVEMHIDGRTETAGPGSIFHLEADAVTRLRNVGPLPATYIVINYYTPLTPKG